MKDAKGSEEKTRIVDVIGCARCGKDHPILPKGELSQSTFEMGGEIFTHFFICSNISEPVVFKVIRAG